MRSSWAGAGSLWAPWASQEARRPATAGQASAWVILSAALLSKKFLLGRSDCKFQVG